MRKILIPTDFSDCAKNALNYALAMSDHDDTEFVLLNAYDIPKGGSSTMLVSITDILKKDSEDGMKKLVQEIKNEGFNGNLRTLSRHGQLTEEIQEILKEEEFNVIVIGTVGSGGLKKVLLGSNASEVVKKIKMPVLIIPKEAKYVVPDKILFTTDFKPIKREQQVQRLLNFSEHVGAEIMILGILKGGKQENIDEAKKKSGLEELFAGTNHSFHFRNDEDIIEGIDKFVKENEIKIVSMILRQMSFIDSLFHKSLTTEMAMHTKIPMLALHD